MGALGISKRLQAEGLGCLRPEDAIVLQALLHSSTLPVIQPWSPDALR